MGSTENALGLNTDIVFLIEHIQHSQLIFTINIYHLLSNEENTKKHWYKDYSILSNMGSTENVLGLNTVNFLNWTYSAL